MTCTIAVARCGQQRRRFRILQVLRVATARSPMARMRAWARDGRVEVVGEGGEQVDGFPVTSPVHSQGNRGP